MARGMSTRALKVRRPGQRYRVRMNAMAVAVPPSRARAPGLRGRAATSRLFLRGPLPHRIDDVFPRVLPSAQVVDGERFGHQGVLGPALLLDVPVHRTTAVVL